MSNVATFVLPLVGHEDGFQLHILLLCGDSNHFRGIDPLFLSMLATIPCFFYFAMHGVSVGCPALEEAT